MPIPFKNFLLALVMIFVLSTPLAHGQTTDTTTVHEDSLVVMIYTTFVVDQKGWVRDIEVLRTECDSCSTEIKEKYEREALRVVNDMPQFSPSKRRGKPEPIRYNLPVRFIVAKD